MSQKDLVYYRRYDVGFVFQFYNLMQNLTALENVEIAAQICKNPLDAAETLQAVGLGDRMDNFSGAALRRRAAARCDCKSDCEESKDPTLRRAYGRVGFSYGNHHSEAPAGYFAGILIRM